MIFAKQVKKFSVIVWILFFALPMLINAQTPPGNIPPSPPVPTPAPAGASGITWECSPPGNCTFGDLINAVKTVVKWGTIFALEFSVVVIAYAGFKYMISGEKPAERAAANKMLRSVVIGIIFILAAWLIVTLIISGLKVTAPTFLK